MGEKSTYGNDLEKVSKKLFGNKFIGVYSSDMVPELKNGDMAIVNLDKYYQIGSHWISISQYDNNLLVYDSFGRETHDILPDFNYEGDIIDADYDSEQDIKEYNCGPRSIAFLNVLDKLGPEYAMLI